MLRRAILSLPAFALRVSRRCASTMTSIQVHEVGDETKLRLNTRTEIPVLSPTECLVENHYAGLNFHDTYTRSGLYPLSLPFVVGCEGGGVVKEIGSRVEHVKIGDRVVYLQEGGNGSYAEFTNVEYTRLMPVPDNVDLDVATAVAVQGLTAHYLVHDSYPLKNGDWCLIHAAAGGTGQILVQMAKNKGAKIIGTCSTEEKAAVARARGCDFVILTKSGKNDDTKDDMWPQVATQVKQIITENSDEPIIASNYGPLNINDGAHCVYDGVGKASAMASLESLRPRGTAVLYGNASGTPPDIPPLLLSKLGSLSMTRPKLHDFIRTRDEVVERSSDVFNMLQRQEVEFCIQDKIKFTRGGVIHGTRLLQDRKTMGKVLFDIKGGLEPKQAAASSIMASRKVFSPKISNLSNEIARSTIEDAYLAQEFVKNIILENDSDTEPIGFKIAATSSMAQQSVAVTEPFFGTLFSHSTFASPATISVSDSTLGLQDKFLLIEPEFALRMKDDLEISTDYTFESIKGHIEAIIPSVEIVSSAYSISSFDDFKKLGAPALIADNAVHGGLVLGKEVSEEASDEFESTLDALDGQAVSLEVNGEPVAQGSGDKVLGHPINALCWLANELGKQGKALRKGDLITTGVVVDSLVVAKSGDTISVDYGGMGNVVFNFVD